MNNPDDWLLEAMLTGLQKLQTLSLDRSPAADVLPGTALAWVEALTHGRCWDENRDTPRLRDGFATLAQTVTRWPAPRELLDALPAFESAPALKHDRGIPATREGRVQRLRDLLKDQFTPEVADPEFDPVKHHARVDKRAAAAEIAGRHEGQEDAA